MKILHLTLKKKWFDLIASKKKVTEYREYKPYWERRLLNKKFDEIHFRNGYSKNAPFMKVVWEGMTTISPASTKFKPVNGEDLKGRYFAIKLGDILEVIP